MRSGCVKIAAVVVVAVCAAVVAVAAQDEAPKPIGASPEMKKPGGGMPSRPTMTPDEMKKLMEAELAKMGPGPEHAVLKPLIGSWSLATKVFMDPNSPPMESGGTAEAVSEYDGRYVIVRTDGVVMGMPWKGSYMLGFDRYKKQYTLVIWSNMGTDINTGTGSYDEKSRTITYKVVMDNAQGKRDTRLTIRFEGDDRHVMEVYDTLPGGQEVRVLETVFTRGK